MDDRILLDLAIALRAVTDLQIKQTKATSVIVSRLNLLHEVETAQNLTGDSESQSLQLLRSKIQSIVDLLSKTQDQDRTK